LAELVVLETSAERFFDFVESARGIIGRRAELALEQYFD
jgi:hypothetical protein